MIALTQEKREELIQYAKFISAQYDHDEELCEIMEIALASLTAKPVSYMTYKGYLLHAADPKVSEYSDPEPLYDAPPVPEINTSSELTALLNAVESFKVVKASDKWNESGKWDNAYDKLSEAAIKAAPLIKRLNGSGE
ncbi:hypothetical protein [Rosenbergiella nectarea]|uniref:hypothetical protein n=1 Tax=Rosenbergiella nectarea TaxID=988801 RepID=UPI001F4DBBC3|nr:hypothetical protein [Rosenbergiella nectarea]